MQYPVYIGLPYKIAIKYGKRGVEHDAVIVVAFWPVIGVVMGQNVKKF